MITHHSFIVNRESDTHSSFNNNDSARILVVEDRADRLRFRTIAVSTITETLQKSAGFTTISFVGGKVRIYGSVEDDTGVAKTAKEINPATIVNQINLQSTGLLTMNRGLATDAYIKNNGLILNRLLVRLAVENGITPTFPHTHYLKWETPPIFFHTSKDKSATVIERYLGPPTILFMLLYPVLGQLIGYNKAYVEFSRNTDTKNIVFEGFKQKTVEACVETIFPGKSTRHTRKLFVDTLFPEKNNWDTEAIDFLIMLSSVSKKLKIDHIHSILSARLNKDKKDIRTSLYPTYSHIRQDHKTGLVHLAKIVQPTKLCDLLTEWQGVPNSDHLFLDTLNMISQTIKQDKVIELEGRLRGVNDLHDKITLKNLELTFNSKEIPLPKEVLALNGTKVGDYTLMVPDNTLQLAIWSSKMHNCIRSYADQAVRRTTLLMGLYDEDRVVYNISIEPDYYNSRQGNSNGNLRLIQFYGPRNSWPKPEDKEKFQEWMKDNKETLNKVFQSRNAR